MMASNIRPAIFLLLLAVVSLARQKTYAQSSGVQYSYDADGRLTSVVNAQGQGVIYTYDSVGNLISIQPIGPDSFALFSFSPAFGLPGDRVSLRGVGLDSVTSVSFNGTAAQVLGSTSTSVTAQVPAGATTGPITIAGAKGTITSSASFTIAGVQITPQAISISSGASVSFAASVIGIQDQVVFWSVNGVAGGNNSVGTVDANGVYQAPTTSAGLVVAVTATSRANSLMAGTAAVGILPAHPSAAVQSAPISVGPGTSVSSIFVAPSVSIGMASSEASSVLSPAVSVGQGGEGAASAILAPGVSVEVASAQASLLLSPAVSVVQSSAAGSVFTARAVSVRTAPESSAGSTFMASSVSVNRGPGTPANLLSSAVAVRFGSTSTPEFSSAVSATRGPVISSVSPRAWQRGASTTVTVTGRNLGGVTTITLLSSVSGIEPNCQATNISVSADGTNLTFTAVVGTNATPGVDAAYVTTPSDRSSIDDTGNNEVQIQ